VLGLEAGASPSEITKAYRKLSMEHPPDKNPQDPEGAAERMANINNAYEKLNEISKRRDEKAAGTGAGSKRSRDEKAKRYRGEK
jgi:curved DNA-binding protein CbpA